MSEPVLKSALRNTSKYSMPSTSFQRTKTRVRFVSTEQYARSSALDTLNYLTAKYGSFQKTPSQLAFSEELYRRGVNVYLLLTGFFSFFFLLTIATHRHFFYIKNPLRVRCIIPELDAKFTKYEEVLNLSLATPTFTPSPYGQYCYYNKRNSTKLTEDHINDYELIMEHLRKDEGYVEQINCDKIKANYIKYLSDDYKIHGEYRSIVEDYNLVCGSYKSWMPTIMITPTISSVILSIPFGILGDIYGRKFVLVISLLLEIVGSLLMFCPSLFLLFFGQIVSGFAGFIAFLSLYTIFSEMCNTYTRLHLGIIIFLGQGCANVFLYILFFIIRVWKMNLLVITVCHVFNLFVIWYIDESPRWLFYTGEIKEAYNNLKRNFKNINLPEMRHEVEVKRPSLREVLKFYKKSIFKSRIILTTTVSFLIATVSSMDYRPPHTISIGRFEYHLTAGISEMISTILLYILLLTCGRRSALFIIIIFLTLVNLIIFLYKELKNQTILISLLIFKLLSKAGLICIIFQVLELYPTRYRFTAVGITACAIEAGKVFSYFYEATLTPKPQSFAYVPLFMFSITAWLLTCFFKETCDRDLPDLETEALLWSEAKIQELVGKIDEA